MKIAFLTESNYQGKVPTNHVNMRTEMAWQAVLNSDHFNIHKYEQVKDYEVVFIIFPKATVKLNMVGIEMTTNMVDNDISIYSKPIVETLKKNNGKICFIQEGPHHLFNDYSVLDQFNFYNQLAECDILFAHNECDTHFYKGLFPQTKVAVIPSLMISPIITEGTLKQDKAIINGNMAAWYGAFQSYVVASSFNCPIYAPSMHCKRLGEEAVPNLTHLPYMNWSQWINHISSYKYAVSMMPTIAAGTFSMNCLSDDTDILTESGIKRIKDCNIGEKVLSLNKNTNKVGYKSIINKINRTPDQHEQIYHINGRSVDFIATDNHDFIIQNLNNNKIETIKTKHLIQKYKFKFPSSLPIDGIKDEYIDLIPLMKDDEFVVIYISFKEFKKIIKNKISLNLTYKDMLDMTRRDIDYSLKREPFVRLSIAFIRKHNINLDDFAKYYILIERFINEYANEIPHKIKTKDFFKLLGLYISEGYCNKDTYRICISQSKTRVRGISRYESIKKELSWIKNINCKDTYFDISSPILNRILSDLGGNGALNKKIPNWIFKYDYSLLLHLFDGLMLGDGGANGNCYFTSSNTLKSDFSKLCIHMGYGITITRSGKKGDELCPGFIHNNDSYIIYIRKHNPGSFLRNKKYKNVTSSIENVTCVEIEDNHTFLGGRNGKFQWIGNCAYFGIPCIGNIKVDTQRLLFPDCSVDVEDVHAARIIALQLRENSIFYNEVSNHARLTLKNSYHLNSKKWLEYMEKELL